MNFGKTTFLAIDDVATYQREMAILAALEQGKMTAADVVEARIGPARPAGTLMEKNIAVVPLYGTVHPRPNLMTAMGFGTPLTHFTAAIRVAVADPSVAGILIDVDSPGGQVYGTEEAAAEVYRARQAKPTYAIANPLAASAGYWIAASAERLFVTPSGEAGHIGVFAVHQDASKALENEGITTTVVSAGKRKLDGSPFGPLTDEARASWQARVDEVYGMFTRSVARGRGVSVEQVRDGMGEGAVLSARAAVREGMADEVGTFDRALNALAYRVRQGAPAGKVAAEADGKVYIGGNFAGTATGGGTGVYDPMTKTLSITINGEPVTDADLDAAEASKAAEHAEDGVPVSRDVYIDGKKVTGTDWKPDPDPSAPEPAGLSAVEQADIDRRRRRARAASLRVAVRS